MAQYFSHFVENPLLRQFVTKLRAVTVSGLGCGLSAGTVREIEKKKRRALIPVGGSRETSISKQLLDNKSNFR
jgi:hypothetical protein